MSRMEITHSDISTRSGALDLTIHHIKKLVKFLVNFLKEIKNLFHINLKDKTT